METRFKEFSRGIYNEVFAETMSSFASSKRKVKKDERERIAQKEAIKSAILKTVERYPTVSVPQIWRGIYEIHVHRKSGIDDANVIDRVVSAEQSWRKSSGHAFEEIIKLLGNAALEGTGVELLLQRDLSTLIKADEIANEPRDISWLKEQIDGSVFDLFVTYVVNNKRYCFGCVQSKTSIRDRVTRDREPSRAAMRSFFWSVAVVLDGDFLKNPKFSAMVDGGAKGFSGNGWHGMYVFAEHDRGERIYTLDVDFKKFATHAVKAAKFWRKERQWFNSDWKADA